MPGLTLGQSQYYQIFANYNPRWVCFWCGYPNFNAVFDNTPASYLLHFTSFTSSNAKLISNKAYCNAEPLSINCFALFSSAERNKWQVSLVQYADVEVLQVQMGTHFSPVFCWWCSIKAGSVFKLPAAKRENVMLYPTLSFDIEYDRILIPIISGFCISISLNFSGYSFCHPQFTYCHGFRHWVSPCFRIFRH